MAMRISKNRIDMDDNVLQKPVLKDYGETVVTANSSTSYTVNLTNGNVFNITMTGNCSFTFSNPPASGTAGSFTLYLTQDATGSRTVTWPGAVTWIGGSEPTLAAAPESIDILIFYTIDGGTTWFGSLSATYPGPPDLTFISNVSQNTTATTWNPSGTFSVPYDGLLVVAGGCWMDGGATRTITSMDIGGNSGTPESRVTNATYNPCAIRVLEVSAGDIDVTMTINSSGTARWHMAAWLLRGYQSTTPYDTEANASTSNSSSKSVTMNLPEDGVAVIMHTHWQTSGTSWTNATEEFDAVVDAGRGSGATYQATAETVGRVFTASYSSEVGGIAGIVLR